jgi:hypothetical protein
MMPAVPFKELLLQEVETLPEQQQADVLAFVRFLKIGLADKQTIERQFVEALARARALAVERGITDRVIAEEIQAVRAGR